MNLTLPATLEEERQMWEALTSFVRLPQGNGDAGALDSYRQRQTSSPSAEKDQDLE
jgi:hypothetical protein